MVRPQDRRAGDGATHLERAGPGGHRSSLHLFSPSRAPSLPPGRSRERHTPDPPPSATATPRGRRNEVWTTRGSGAYQRQASPHLRATRPAGSFPGLGAREGLPLLPPPPSRPARRALPEVPPPRRGAGVLRAWLGTLTDRGTPGTHGRWGWEGPACPAGRQRSVTPSFLASFPTAYPRAGSFGTASGERKPSFHRTAAPSRTAQRCTGATTNRSIPPP